MGQQTKKIKAQLEAHWQRSRQGNGNTPLTLCTFKPEEIFPIIGKQPKDFLVKLPTKSGFLPINVEVSAAKRRHVLLKERPSCEACGLKGTFFKLMMDKQCCPYIQFFGKDTKSRTIMLTIDHIVPIALGGKNHDKNLQVLCGVCNRVKADEIMSTKEIITRRGLNPIPLPIFGSVMLSKLIVKFLDSVRGRFFK